MNLMQIAKQDGIRDLPVSVRGPFAQALLAEMEGDHEKAEAKLDQAVAAEAKL